jgi:hypothetical protein
MHALLVTLHGCKVRCHACPLVEVSLAGGPTSDLQPLVQEQFAKSRADRVMARGGAELLCPILQGRASEVPGQLAATTTTSQSQSLPGDSFS